MLADANDVDLARLRLPREPVRHDHLPPSSEGERLLVGRDAELGRLHTFLRSSARHPTLEGENGVGKTSLVNVAGYQAQREFEQKKTGQLLITRASLPAHEHR
jgi:MoxR-like ATPase